MTFIECFPGESDSTVVDMLRHTFTSVIEQPSPEIELCDLIDWGERSFREFRLRMLNDRLVHEEPLFLHVGDKLNRAALQLGYLHRDVFCMPLSPSRQAVALLIDNAPQITVDPFIFSMRT
jgi:hypothetical protein